MSLEKPRLLLHTCCVLCSCAVLEKLRQDFKLTVFFYNPNIQPREEYEKRRDTVREWCEQVGLPFVEGAAGFNEWSEAVKGREHEPEGGARCPLCFEVRLAEAAAHAAKNGFEWLATTLTMGRNKKAGVINALGEKAAAAHDLQFYAADWKKNGGQERANEIAKENNLYRQNYCGCLFSKKSI